MRSVTAISTVAAASAAAVAIWRVLRVTEWKNDEQPLHAGSVMLDLAGTSKPFLKPGRP